TTPYPSRRERTCATTQLELPLGEQICAKQSCFTQLYADIQLSADIQLYAAIQVYADSQLYADTQFYIDTHNFTLYLKVLLFNFATQSTFTHKNEMHYGKYI